VLEVRLAVLEEVERDPEVLGLRAARMKRRPSRCVERPMRTNISADRLQSA